MSQGSWISLIAKLIETCKDGEYGYREAAARVSDSALKLFLEEQSAERGRFARELENEISRISAARTQGSVAAAMHRGWIGLQAVLGRGDSVIMDAVRQGERSAIETYNTALAAAMPKPLESMVRRQAESIRQAYAKTESWKEKPAA